tara:strand:+ start:505 stop:921 length:417 start_codon:yes stop_codon:yes gene_type:complete
MIHIKKIDSDLTVILKEKDYINEERGTKLVNEFLDQMKKRKTVNKSGGTYGLKHVIERWAEKKYGGHPNNNYIDEGILINEAIKKGFKAVPVYLNISKFDSCYLNISERSLNEIEKYMEDLFPYGNYKMYQGYKVSMR